MSQRGRRWIVAGVALAAVSGFDGTDIAPLLPLDQRLRAASVYRGS
jgi:hypothetical protein